MNAHIPQSVEAATELREIAAVPLQIVSPRESVPIVSVVQDTLVGANRFTRPNVLFGRREALNLLIHSKRWDGVLPPPVATEPQPMWSGQQLLSALLPPVSLQMPNSSYGDSDKGNPTSHNLVKIKDGQILQGILDKSVFSKQLLHIIYNDYGPDMTVDFLDALQAMIANFLMNSGFSVGISDLIADDATLQEINSALGGLVQTVENQILQLHTGLFENASGRSNQDEFEGKAMSVLNKAVGVAGGIGLKTLAETNRMTNMVKAGSKGSDVNVSQMIGSLGQTAIEGKRVPNGFQHRTLPHFKRFDDSARARGFIASSYIKGLQPDEFFFHAMSGREGLIDTAVKSVTGDTPIIILEDGMVKRVPIGDWIDAHLDAHKKEVEHFDTRNLEMLQLESPTYIPTVGEDGSVTWGAVAAVTRHDPGTELYEVTTHGGRKVIVTESKSLLVWDASEKKLLNKPTPDVKVGDCVPVTMNLATPPVLTKSIQVATYLPKTQFLYGSDFIKATYAVEEAMNDRDRIPAHWWSTHNGTTFTLPYSDKAKFTRALHRSAVGHIKPGFVYPFTTNREHGISDEFVFTHENGVFLGLFLAEGNVDIESGYVQITNNDKHIREFAKAWFEKQGLSVSEEIKENHIGGTSSSVRGYSTLLATFLTRLVGSGAANKYVPTEAFAAPEEFITGLLSGYISGDGCVTDNGIEVGSASPVLAEGIATLCSRLGVFARMSSSKLETNNLGTKNIATSHRLSIRAQWATLFMEKVTLLSTEKQERLLAMKFSSVHRNFTEQNDVVLDKIVDIKVLDAAKYPKVYDLTVPETFTFGLANGLQVYDTADTGYMQRQIRVALEDLVTHHDGSVRDATGNVVQISYGEDGANATKLESQTLPLAAMSDEDIRAHYVAEGAEDADAYLRAAFGDRKLLVEQVYGGKPQKNVRYPVHLERILQAVRSGFGLQDGAGTVTAGDALAAQKKILDRTHGKNRLWAALVRYHLAPTMLKKAGFTPVALDTLVERIVLGHWKSWVEPGQPVGVIAAQSIGEPATQMTLNSVDFSTVIMIGRDKKLLTIAIGEFIEEYAKTCDPAKIQHLPNNQIYIPLEDGHEWSAVSCDEDGKMQWTRLEAITKHPVVNEDGSDTILEVELESGRVVKATKALSFLTYREGKIVGLMGADLRVGDKMPVAKSLAIEGLGIVESLDMRTVLPPTEWLYGSEVTKALEAMHAADAAGVRHWFSHANGKEFTVPYARSDSFRKAFAQGGNRRAEDMCKDCVYPKATNTCMSNIPATIPLTREFGFFVGAFLAEGSTSETQIQITNNDDAYLAPIRSLLDAWSVGHHTVCKDMTIEKTGISGHTQSLIVHSTVLATAFRSMFGHLSQNKTMPDWVLQAPDNFVAGLLDGYISGDGYVQSSGMISMTSASEDLLTRMSALLARYGIFGTMQSSMPELGKFGSVCRHYKYSLLAKYGKVFAERFTLTIAKKQERLEAFKGVERRCLRQEVGDVVLDTVKRITEVPPKGGFVYDLTVEKTRNFTVLNQLCVKDTFHLSGVASKSAMTRGVPRLKELLKATHNPKAVELTIPLRHDLRDKKEDARRVAQELEFTLLQDIVTVARIYYDPRDSATLISEDIDWLAYMAAFENARTTPAAPAAGGAAAADPLSGNALAAEAVDGGEEFKSPWILRFELDRERMFNKNITMDDVAFILKRAISVPVGIVYTDYNATRLVFRIRLLNEANARNELDTLNALKSLQNKILSSTVVRGIPGLRAVNYQKVSDLVELRDGKYAPVDQYVLITDGSNFLEVLTHPDVDPSRVVSSNVHDMFDNLGIEATRATFFKEITTLFAESGSSVNYRHVGMLIDKMCHKGRTMSIDRYGINKNDIGPLAKMSFEQTEDIALRAAAFGERDPVLGVSAKVMLGAPIKAGTAFSELLFDEQTAIKLAESTPEQRPAVLSGPQLFTAEDIDSALYGDGRGDDSECGADALRMQVALPAIAEDEQLVTEDMGDVDITVVE